MLVTACFLLIFGNVFFYVWRQCCPTTRPDSLSRASKVFWCLNSSRRSCLDVLLSSCREPIINAITPNQKTGDAPLRVAPICVFSWFVLLVRLARVGLKRYASSNECLATRTGACVTATSTSKCCSRYCI